MAKKQTRRSISVSRTTYERLKAFCEANNISMSQLVETRVNDFLGSGPLPEAPAAPSPSAMTFGSVPRPASVAVPAPVRPAPQPSAPAARPERVSLASVTPTTTSTAVPMTSAAARFAVEPPPPIIKPKQETAAPKPAEKRPDQIFTF